MFVLRIISLGVFISLYRGVDGIELSNTSYGGFEADRFNITFTFDYKKQFQSIANGNSDSIICHYIWSPNTFTVYHFNLVNHETF